jgi:folate-dependent tRNA-U54 methylase TrmFO/GidA
LPVRLHGMRHKQLTQNHTPIQGVSMQVEKKKAAAIAAVMAYLKTEEEIAAAGIAAAQAAARLPAGAAVSVDMWGLSGRQAMMQMRSMMQMKSFHGNRFR